MKLIKAFHLLKHENIIIYYLNTYIILFIYYSISIKNICYFISTEFFSISKIIKNNFRILN